MNFRITRFYKFSARFQNALIVMAKICNAKPASHIKFFAARAIGQITTLCLGYKLLAKVKFFINVRQLLVRKTFYRYQTSEGVKLKASSTVYIGRNRHN